MNRLTAGMLGMMAAIVATAMCGCAKPVGSPAPGASGALGGPTAGASSSAMSPAGERLLAAAEYGKIDIAEETLDANSELINVRDAHGWTPLHWAVASGDKEMVSFLLSRGADPSARTSQGWTPLHRAAYSGTKEVVDILLGSQADPNAVDVDGMTPLHWAAYRGDTGVVESLLVKGASPRARDKYGRNAWDLAGIHDHKNVIDLLDKFTMMYRTGSPATAPATGGVPH